MIFTKINIMIKEDKSIIRLMNEAKVYLRIICYELCLFIGIFKIIYPHIKQPYKRWYKKHKKNNYDKRI